MSDQPTGDTNTRSMLDLEGNEQGASSDGDTGPEGAHNAPKPGNHPEQSAGDDAEGAGQG
jgi:hypothetical protein